MYIHIYTAEVQPPCCIGWFPNHHYFSRVFLSSSKKEPAFSTWWVTSRVNILYRMYIHTLVQSSMAMESPPTVSRWFFASKIDTLSRLRYLTFYQSDQLSIIPYRKPRKFLRLSRRKQNKTKQNKTKQNKTKQTNKQTNSNSATSNACIWGLVVMSLHLLGVGIFNQRGLASDGDLLPLLPKPRGGGNHVNRHLLR